MSTVMKTERSGRWLADPGFGVYVHTPFCLHRCHYCDFNTYEGLDALHEPYVDALIRDIARYDGEVRPATSIYFGGGTPTLLSPDALARVLDAVRDATGIDPGAEITIEANPETVDVDTFERLLEAGFDRVSLGVQSLSPNVLEKLGRVHSADRALVAIDDAFRAGFEDVNADLIYGSPWETDEDWLRSLEGVIDSAPTHISAYSLMVEEGTPLATLVATGRVPDVDPDVQAARYEVAAEVLEGAGYERYEISNWARPGHASRHNVLYWCAGDYLGFGAGAHGHLQGTRSWSVRLPRDFIGRIQEGASVTDGYESLSEDQRAGEALMLGLRLTSGIDLTDFKERFGSEPLVARKATLGALESAGLVLNNGGRLRLTTRGTLLANEALCQIL